MASSDAHADNGGVIKLTLYVTIADEHAHELAEQLRVALDEEHDSEVVLEVVDVLAMPDKAIANDVFVTPTLVRDLPTPALRILGDLAQTHSVLLAMQTPGDDHAVIV